jgi:hypothetical protein
MFSVPECDTLVLWSQRLAHRVAPDEIDIAADLVIAYAAGGAERRALFLRPRTDPGSFGTGLALFLPLVCQALDAAYTTLRAVLSDPSVANIVAISGLVFSYRQARNEHRQTDSQRPAGPAADAIDATTDQVRAEFERAGLPTQEAERKATEVLGELLHDPVSATEFLDRLHGDRP